MTYSHLLKHHLNLIFLDFLFTKSLMIFTQFKFQVSYFSIKNKKPSQKDLLGT